MSQEPPQESITLLILTTRPQEMVSVEKFLSKRGFTLVIKDNMRDGLAFIGRSSPDWVFISVNLTGSMAKYQELLKSTLNIEPVFFADEMDKPALRLLNTFRESSIITKLTGPVIQMRLAQTLADSQPKQRTTVGIRPSAFVHVKGEPAPAPAPIVMSGPSREVVTKEKSPEVGKVNVITFESGDQSGYVVVGSALNSETVKADLEHQASEIVTSLTGHASRDVRINTVELHINNFPAWATLHGTTVKNFSTENCELVTCYIPEDTPLPEMKTSESDPTKVEIKFRDIPVDTQLPCSLYVHLPQNNKFICLIKKDGTLTAKQQERLAGLGVPSLMISKADIEIFKAFYIRYKLLVASAEESLSA